MAGVLHLIVGSRLRPEAVVTNVTSLDEAPEAMRDHTEACGQDDPRRLNMVGGLIPGLGETSMSLAPCPWRSRRTWP